MASSLDSHFGKLVPDTRRAQSKHDVDVLCIVVSRTKLADGNSTGAEGHHCAKENIMHLLMMQPPISVPFQA